MAGRSPKTPKQSKAYDHSHSESLLRPDIGTQAQFRKKKDPKTYRYDAIEDGLETLRSQLAPKAADGGVVGRLGVRLQADEIAEDQAESQLFFHPAVGDVVAELQERHSPATRRRVR